MAQNYNVALKKHLAMEKQQQEQERQEMMKRFKSNVPVPPV
jgi:ribosomal protein L39E